MNMKEKLESLGKNSIWFAMALLTARRKRRRQCSTKWKAI